MRNYIYDIESYPNVFTMTVKEGENWWVFEISHRKNDIDLIIQLLNVIRFYKDRMVGFNNIGYDYPVLHYVINHRPSAELIYDKSMSIINSADRFSHVIWDRDQYVPQVDLFKIHHFDNLAKSTSLKMLEFNMRQESIQDLPFPPGTILTDDQIDMLIEYNKHDVFSTALFLEESKEAIAFREELSKKYDRNFLNQNDTKIGKDYFIMELERVSPGCCYGPGRNPCQTPREFINLADVILPYITFKKPEFEQMKNWFAAQSITETKGVFKNLSCTVNGFQFDFGAGGIHGSVESQTVVSDDEYAVIDVDVTSYYPSLAIVNRLFPAHLGETFCDIYADVKQQRMKYKKGTPENLMLKLALNGVYGDSNNKYGPFYDPQYTMSITINGQLLLCLLSDYVMDIPGLQMIQINTDGITVRCPRSQLDLFRKICTWWEKYTGLDLEYADYSRMFIRDVNNYIAEYEGGKLKKKGAYLYELGWHQNHSALVIPKAAEAALVHGKDIRQFIYDHTEPMDFLLRTKVPRSSKLMHGDRQIQNISRYYISLDGLPLVKIMPPLKRKPDQWRKIGINVGWLATECNEWNGSLAGINYDFYIKETEKIVNPLKSACKLI